MRAMRNLPVVPICRTLSRLRRGVKTLGSRKAATTGYFAWGCFRYFGCAAGRVRHAAVAREAAGALAPDIPCALRFKGREILAKLGRARAVSANLFPLV